MTVPSAPRLDEAPAVVVLHENPEWLPPIREAFAAEGVPLAELDLSTGSIDLAAEPPQGVFWSRLSASSPSRGNPHAKDAARAVLRWLEAHGRRVVNGSRVLELEVSKVAQTVALAAAGFDVPRTIAVFGTADLVARSHELAAPFITKHNQGGKGLGVRRFDSHEEFAEASTEFETPVDGVTLLQEHLVAAEPFITRAEFVDGEFLYAVRVDTSAGSFELCPAEACAVPEAAGALGSEGEFAARSSLLPATGIAAAARLFRIRPEITAGTPLIARLRDFLREQGVEIAGVEFIETADGRQVVYDINTNTNYHPDVEASLELPGARAVARALGRELAAVSVR